MSTEERRENYRIFTQETVQHESTVTSYIGSLDEEFPEKLGIDTIFNITDLDELRDISDRCKNGDLEQWSSNLGNHRPKAAINKYIENIDNIRYKEFFIKVTNNNNGRITGIRTRELPDQEENARNIVKKFNKFTKKICPNHIALGNISNHWQSSGYYKPYFFNKYQEENGISFWLSVDASGIKIEFGTTDDIEDEIYRNKINDKIWENYSGKVYPSFTETRETGYLGYKYIGNNENNNIGEFKKIVSDTHANYTDFIANIEMILESKHKKSNNMNTKNIILYGAPGVGKTHNINKLISLIEEGKKSDFEIFKKIENIETKETKQLDDELKSRVEFVTFHQSYSYEDFIEGFRPQEGNQIKLEDGVFKNICEIAIKNLENSKRITKLALDLELLLNDFANHINEEISLGNNPVLTIENGFKNKSYFGEVNFSSDESFQSFSTTGSVKNQSLTRNIIVRDYQHFYDGEINGYKDIKPSFKSKSSYHGNAIYYYQLFLVMKKFQEQSETNYVISEVDKKQKNFYIVIDEINRGNISKIFGELITLIEESKRDEYEVTLPYSKEKFKVPSNLYIIATMNSTDKSIATIDIALRRRFTFLKMEPNSNLVKNPQSKKLMQKLNKHIKETINEDFQLGHSYFMGENIDLEFIKKYKIEPLLEEYFYADEENLKKALEILGDNNNE